MKNRTQRISNIRISNLFTINENEDESSSNHVRIRERHEEIPVSDGSNPSL